MKLIELITVSTSFRKPRTQHCGGTASELKRVTAVGSGSCQNLPN